MIVVNPAKRCSSEDVLNEANKFLESSKKTMLDSFITMDDIQLKLVLLEYEVGFCKVAERKPVNKLYFAIEDKACPVNDQLYYFLELTYWLMTLSKPDRRK